MKSGTGVIKINYIGNSYFYITFPDGTRLATDPYGRMYEHFFGPVPALEADVITISHNHDDHLSGIGELSGEPLVIGPEQDCNSVMVGDVKITGFITEHVAGMGQNMVYIYEANGYKIVHMGETDLIASGDAVSAVQNADVILAYAGQYGTIKNRENFRTLFGWNIKTVIPQHFSNNPEEIFYGEPVIHEILKDVPAGVKVMERKQILITKDPEARFVILDPHGHKS